MYKVKDEVKIKTVDVLINEGHLRPIEKNENVLINEASFFVIYKDNPLFGNTQIIQNVDENDKDIPYFTKSGMWIPSFMIVPPIKKPIVPEIIKEKPIVNAIDVNEPIINKHTGVAFGKLFITLIKLDPKIAEFSSTSFGRLKKVELIYIAKLLMRQGLGDIDVNMLKPDLARECFIKTKELNV